jgi:hypothetical protein
MPHLELNGLMLGWQPQYALLVSRRTREPVALPGETTDARSACRWPDRLPSASDNDLKVKSDRSPNLKTVD